MCVGVVKSPAEYGSERGRADVPSSEGRNPRALSRYRHRRIHYRGFGAAAMGGRHRETVFGATTENQGDSGHINGPTQDYGTAPVLSCCIPPVASP